MDITGEKVKLGKQITIFTWIGGVSAVVALIPLAWAGYEVLGNHSFFKENELGDFIGGTSGTFASFAGLAFVYVAFLGQRLQILMQQEELELNRKELKETRNEIRGQKEQLELQNKQFQIQSFENVFFELISFFRKQSEINFSRGYGDYPLIEKLNEFIEEYRKSVSLDQWEKMDDHGKILYLAKIYDKNFSAGFARVRSLIEVSILILIHIDKGKNYIDPIYYHNIFKSSLNVHEQRIIFYGFFSAKIYLGEDEREFFKCFLDGFLMQNLLDPSHKLFLNAFE